MKSRPRLDDGDEDSDDFEPVKSLHSSEHLVDVSFHRTAFDQHFSCWSCLLWCILPQKRKQQRDVGRRLAYLSADFAHDSPDCFTWVRFLRGLNKQFWDEEKYDLEQKCERGIQVDANPGHVFNFDAIPSPVGGSAFPMHAASQVIAHFALFQLAAYGKKLCPLIYPVSSCLKLVTCGLSDHKAFQLITGVEYKDILYAKPTAKPFKPAWWLCLDRKANAIVVAVRGTFSVNDILSDVFATQADYKEHLLHEGIYTSANWLRRELTRMLSDLPDEVLVELGWRIVLVGHSLGGAVAAVVGFFLRECGVVDKHGKPFPVLCFTYGAPQCQDLSLACKMKQFTLGVIHHHDMIPRISAKSLYDLRDAASASVETPAKRLKELEKVLAEFHLPCEPEKLRHALATPHTIEHASSAFKEAHSSKSLAPAVHMERPGWQLHVGRWAASSRCKSQGLVPANNVIWRKGSLSNCVFTLRAPDLKSVNVVHPSWTMWTDHWPNGYLFACEVLAEKLAGVSRDAALSDLLQSLQKFMEKT